MISGRAAANGFRHMIWFNMVSLSVLLAAPPGDSPFGVASTGVSGQVRLRTEYDGKAVADTSANKVLLSTGLRTRLAFTATPAEAVDVRVELQDTRSMGSEPPAAAANPATSSTGNSKGVDLLQGYAEIKEGGFKAVLGRQKMTLGSGRFLSSLDWSPTSRSFDGISFNAEGGPGSLTGLAYLVRDTSEKTVEDRMLLTGLYYSKPLVPVLSADVYAFYDQSRIPTVYGGLTSANYDLAYFGERLSGKAGFLTYEEEFVWQAGEVHTARDLTSEAFQLALRAGGSFGLAKFNAGLDMMSGDDDPSDGTVASYRANYFFAHAYFGWMDYFVANPAHGVTDYRLDGDFGFLPNASGAASISLKPQYHLFMPQNAPAGADQAYGQELDLEIHYTRYAKTNLVLGAGVFIPGDQAKDLQVAALKAGQSTLPGFFLYCMPTINF